MDIFLLFARIGVTTFGGGYGMLPVLQHELVDKAGWLTDAELTDIYALAQCQPGLIAVNTAVLITSPRKGTAAAFAATLGVSMPSWIIILLLAALLGQYAHLTWVGQAFAGIRVAVAALVLRAAWRLIKNGVRDLVAGGIFALSLLLLLLDLVNPLLIVAGAGLVGSAVQSRRAKALGEKP